MSTLSLSPYMLIDIIISKPEERFPAKHFTDLKLHMLSQLQLPGYTYELTLLPNQLYIDKSSRADNLYTLILNSRSYFKALGYLALKILTSSWVFSEI